MTKREPSEQIKNIKKGNKDPSDNSIIDVLAKGNEYAIYEIETPNIDKTLRVLIDGKDDESEQKLADRFNSVKQKYIEAKGLLYRSENSGMMKNRVAHALATVLSSSEHPSTEEFDELIDDIKKETATAALNRFLYISPGLFLLLTALITAIILSNYGITSGWTWYLSIGSLGASLGGIMSILLNINKLHFEEYKWYIYISLGAERILLALITAGIAYILIKANLILPEFSESDIWTFLSLLIVTGFSEQLVPSFLQKMTDSQ